MSLQLKIDKQAVDPPKLKRLVVDLGSLHALETLPLDLRINQSL